MAVMKLVTTMISLGTGAAMNALAMVYGGSFCLP